MNVRRAFGGKTAIVTGGARGIGKSLGEQLAAAGATVVLADIDEERCRAAAADIARSGGRAVARPLDVTDRDAVSALVAETAAEHGALDLIFNNAGVLAVGAVRDTAPETFDRMLDVNVRGVINGVLAAYPVMIDQGHGHIVNTASLSALIPSPGVVPYSASKHAVLGLSTGLRVEAAAHGVRVSVACPGFIRMMDTAVLSGVDDAGAHAMVPFKWYSADRCVRDMLAGVARNDAVIVVAPHARWMSRLYRLAPTLTQRLADWSYARKRNDRQDPV